MRESGGGESGGAFDEITVLAQGWTFCDFKKLVFFLVTSRILRIPTERIETKNSLDLKLQIDSICSIRVLNVLEVIAKTKLS